jgi:catechol 2,3-dioxygenase-like lactoylglutathione lyase family enzyme
MPLAHIAHYLIAANDIGQTRDWYCNVLGLEEGWHPDFGFPVIWLYANGVDVVHISANARQASESQKAYLGRIAQDTGSGTGAIDHIAFFATGLDESIARLRRHGVEFFERQANGQALHQVFTVDPNGIKVELNFDAMEAQQRGPDAIA